MKAIILNVSAALVIAGLLAASGCTDTAPSGPSASLGSVTVTKYVAIGNSLTAGYQSNGLYESAQIYSYPNLISQQLNAAGANLPAFQQPLWPDPGTPSSATSGVASRYVIISMNGPVVGPANEAITALAPLNAATLARPYDNLGVPGAVIYDFLDTSSFASKAGAPRNNPLFEAILRTPVFGNSILAQATALNPDLVTFWLGNNDVLGYATSGGTSPAAPTDPAIFAQLYGGSLTLLHQALPKAKILAANIPDVAAIPFFTTIGPKIAATLPAGVYLRYQKHGNAGPALDSTRFTEANSPLITLEAGPYAALIGQSPCAQWYHDLAASLGIPFTTLFAQYAAAGIDTTTPFGLSPSNPFPDALVLDAGEQTIATNAITAFNATIANVVANTSGAVVVDMNSFFNSVKANGLSVNGQTFTTAYIAGGLFSLDGVHPSSKGYGIVANQYIKAMNDKLGMHVPYVNVNNLPGIPTPPLSKAHGVQYPNIPLSAWKSFHTLWGSEN